MIYIVLGVLYESFIHPITILSGLPSAVFGALLTLKLFGKEIDLYAFVGLIMLFGVVKKNAIMMIDFAIAAQQEGKTPRRSDLAGLHPAVPPHHDDDCRCTVRHAPNRDGVRRRRRCAATARARRSWRISRQSVLDSVHHSGHLSVFREIAGAVSRQARSRPAAETAN